MSEQLSTVRVFVSSTFRDMHAERDYLNRHVFPELRQRCLARGAEFVAVDLRWGLTKEQTGQQGALQLCLEEIERCRPFFLGLLGQRYGWVPPHEQVTREFFERALRSNLPHADAERLNRFYRLDTTSEPPLYRLRHDNPDALQRAADHLVAFWKTAGLPDAGLSVTAREVHRAVEELALTHALFYLREPGGEGLTSHPHFPGWLTSVFVEGSPDCASNLKALKDELRARHQNGTILVREYRAEYAGLRIDPTLLPAELSASDRHALADGVIQPGEWMGLNPPMLEALKEHGTVALNGMEELGRLALYDLWRAVEAELDRMAARPGHRDIHERERAGHERFVRERSRLFYGRRELLDRLHAYAKSADEAQPFLVTGPAGCGKSALLARFVAETRERRPGALVVPHFIGAVPGTTQLAVTLRSLLETLRRETGLADEVPADPMELWPLLSKFLGRAAAVQPVLLVLDAVNQLDPANGSHELGWLPFGLPPGARLVVSTLPGDCEPPLLERTDAEHQLTVKPLPEPDRRSLIEAHLHLRGKRLTDGQMARLLDLRTRPEAGLPLYLLVALEELYLFGSFEALEERLDLLPPTTTELFGQVLARLEHDHGRELVQRVGRFLVVGRTGLTEPELLDLLRDAEPDFTPMRWARLYRALRFYLRPTEEDAEQEQSGLIGFFHDQIRFAVFRRYLDMATPEAEPTVAFRSTHRQLADSFTAAATDGAGSWSKARPRALAELPYHLGRAQTFDRLYRLLTDLRYLEARTATGQAFALAQDFSAAVADLPEGQSGRAILSLLEEALRRDVHFIADHASDYQQALFQSLWNNCWWYDCPEAAAHYLQGRSPGQEAGVEVHRLLERWRTEKEECMPGFTWLRSLCPPPLKLGSAQLRVMRGHVGRVNAVCYSPDGRRVISGGEDDKTIRVWNVETSQEILCLTGHEKAVSSVSFSPNGRGIVSGSYDKTVRVWDVETGQEILHLTGHEDGVTGVAVSPDGHCIASSSWDGTLRLWDTVSGREVACLRSNLEPPVSSVGFFPDSRRIVSGHGSQIGGAIQVWDIKTGRRLLQMLDQQCATSSVAVSPDGRFIISGSTEWVGIRMWDGPTGRELTKRFELKLGSHVHTVAISPDGRLLGGGEPGREYEGDQTVRIWDVTTGQLISKLHGHTLGVSAVCFSPDGRRIASSGDSTVRLWDVGPGRPHFWTVKHTRYVRGLCYSPDGSRILSWSNEDDICVWDTQTGQVVLRLKEGHADLDWLQQIINTARCSPDGRRVVSAGGDQTVIVWDAQTGERLLTLYGHDRKDVNCATYSPDGMRIASGSRDQTVRVWDAETGRQLLCLTGHEGNVEEVEFTPDGKRIVSGSDDGTVRVWNAETGQCLEVITDTRDFRRVAGGASPGAVEAMREGLGFVLRATATGAAVAWFPPFLDFVEGCPGVGSWGSASGEDVFLFRLEGNPETVEAKTSHGIR